MIDEDERNWKADVETREANDSRDLWRQCAAAGCVALFIAPLALFAIVYLGAGLEDGRWSTHYDFGKFGAAIFLVYGVSLLTSLPASVPSAIVFAVAIYKLRKAGRLNWWTSTIAGALIGALVGTFGSLLFTGGKGPTGSFLAVAGFMALVGAVTTLATYVLCLRRV